MPQTKISPKSKSTVRFFLSLCLTICIYFWPVVWLALLIYPLHANVAALKTSVAATFAPIVATALPAQQVVPDLTTTLSQSQRILKSFAVVLPVTFFKNTPALFLLPATEQLLADTQAVLAFVSSDTKRVHIWLQNSQELRATGGFVGSYAELVFSKGTLASLVIHDIYEPNGQFTGFREAPTGVKQYLSGGKSWKIPDANWSPDFSQSVRTMNWFLDQSNMQRPDITIAINLTTVENIVDSLGQLYLPDQDAVVTSSNLAQIARYNRESFFPGDHQKSTQLTLLLNQLKYAIQTAPLHTKAKIALLLWRDVQRNEIQVYAEDPGISEVFDRYQPQQYVSVLSNPPATSDTTLTFFPIESNVGINKANKAIDRQLTITNDATTTTLSVTFTNNNSTQTTPKPTHKNPDYLEADHLGYINYQRLLLPTSAKVESIVSNGEQITDWDKESVDIGGTPWNQIGFLVTVPEKTTGSFTVVVTTPDSPSQILVIKQSGVLPYPVKINQRTQALWHGNLDGNILQILQN